MKIKFEMSDYLDPNNEELLKDFFIEANLQVEMLEQNILVLENDPNNSESIDEIFRAAHTLKGASATVQMQEISSFTHKIEDVLDEIRSNKLKANNDLIDLLLISIDIIKEMLEERSVGGIYQGNAKAVEDKLGKFLTKQTKSYEPEIEIEPPKEKTPVTGKKEMHIADYELLELQEAADPKETIFKLEVHFNEENLMNSVGGIQVFAALKTVGTILKTDPDFDKLYEDNFYPIVYYYLSSKEDTEKLKETATIPDVTLDINVFKAEAKTSKKEKIEPEQKKPAKKPEIIKEQPLKEEKQTVSKNAVEKYAESEIEEIENIEDIGKDLQETDKDKRAADSLKKAKSMGSVLRVDSRRIDNLLNLVSEAVIIKASFIQTSNKFVNIMAELQNIELIYRESLKELFDSLPGYLNSIQKGKSVKDIKKEIFDKYGELFNIFENFDNDLKGHINKFRSSTQNLGRITSDLHEGVLQIRMVPISQIFSRFPRLVRDISKSLNKKINLVIEGEDTELDKSVIEDLLDPLIHCVRNSVDHGIESQDERRALGKSEEGTVLLKARNEGNMIVIEIIDDGKGINIDLVKEKAIEKGIIHPSKALSEIEAFNLIFQAGFSTAKKVTNISGRGVGLDVVKKQIEKLNGTVSVWSEYGKGTKFSIKLPLTLAIIQGLLVKVGKEIYVIPVTSVIESYRIKASEINVIDNYEVFNFREDVVSLLRLNRLFMIPSKEDDEYKFVVIVGSSDKKIGLMVDSLIGEEDVVIKPLRDRNVMSPGTAGATILGDGTVSLIIDVSQLLDLSVKLEIERRHRKGVVLK